MKVLLLSRYARLGASSRLRSFQYIPYLAERGIEVIAEPLFTDKYISGMYRGDVSVANVIWSYAKRVGALTHGRDFDLVWAEKEMLPWIPAWVELGILGRRVRMAVDYDDATFHRYDLHASRAVRSALGKKIDAIMRRADLVIACNTYLATRATRAGAKQVELLPTVVDLARYSTDSGNSARPLTIGWIGSPATSHYLHSLGDVLRRITSSRAARFVVVGANANDVVGLPAEVRKWSEESEVSEIAQFDIGIMPLPDGPWERGKCGYKLIQYMACAKPVVASPVGVNCEIVRNGIDGFLAVDDVEWAQALEKLCDDEALRRRMGRDGRRRVESSYSVQATAGRLESLLRSAARALPTQ